MNSRFFSAINPPANGSCNPEACVRGDCFRFTLLTERILRMEYDPQGIFEDRPSQTVLYRNFPAPAFTVKDTGSRLEIDSKHYHLTYFYSRDKCFTENSLIIDTKNDFTHYGGAWRFGTDAYGDPPRHHNLGGTARTLDRANGAVALEKGLMDFSGRTWFDDTHAPLLEPDGSLAPRREGTVDAYFVCCQHDYGETLKDFYRITGAPPMLPRYSLGNWWSRYYPYSEETYLQLLDRFQREDIPFSVAVLDMDWHITQIDPKYGIGWTGYTWNRKLFPQPEAFLDTLHTRGFHTALNLHPADGVRAFEDAYPQMAAATGADPEKEEPVLFDMTDPVFLNAYFEHLMHPLEKSGADIWWIDWQQGRKCAIPGVDPLWLLNHYHYLDNCKDGKRGLILSRYAGLGSHRYPAGFSGDSVASWESLDFQAYFTLTAVNAGFPFWSHDIGGFTGGDRDPELFIRWVQLGTFSQFLRLHSTKLPFASKEPWNYGKIAAPIAAKWLRLRHQLIPYIYTEVWHQHRDMVPIIRPAYYEWPGHMSQPNYIQGQSAPQLPVEKNQFLFGSQLMVCPITSPANPKSGLASVKAWIPKGIWTDLLTGKTYVGDRIATLNRSLDEYPVLARAGAIVPTARYPKGSNSTGNPEELEILVFPGASGSFTLFEDDGQSNAWESGAMFQTEFTLDWENRTFRIQGSGDAALVPAQRKIRVTFRGFENFTPQGSCVTEVSYDPQTRSVTAVLESAAPDTVTELALPGMERERNTNKTALAWEFLNLCRIDLAQKVSIYKLVESQPPLMRIFEELITQRVDLSVIDGLMEILID